MVISRSCCCNRVAVMLSDIEVAVDRLGIGAGTGLSFMRSASFHFCLWLDLGPRRPRSLQPFP